LWGQAGGAGRRASGNRLSAAGPASGRTGTGAARSTILDSDKKSDLKAQIMAQVMDGRKHQNMLDSITKQQG